MLAGPKLEQRNEQHYAAIRTQVPIPFGDVLPPLWNEVVAWLASKGMAPAGAPFIRYLTTDMTRKLDIEVGWPLASAVPGNGRISTGVLAAGRYAVLLYTGPYDDLVNANRAMLEWGEQNNMLWQTSKRDNVEWWDGRIEFYLTDPGHEPDPQKWETELAFLVAPA